MARFFQFCGILILAVILYAIGTPIPNTTNIPKPEPAASPAPTPHIRPDEPDHAIIEYGVPEVIKRNNNPMHVYIRFPQAGNETDPVIYDWAYGVYNDINTKFQLELNEDPSALGEINIHFDSYLIDNRYAGIYERGEYSYSLDLSRPPEEILKTFNIDLLNNTFLESTDILDYSQLDLLLDLLHNRMLIEYPGTSGQLGLIDESWFDNLVIGSEGIIAVVERYTMLTEAIPTLTVTLPYEDLGSALLIRKDPPLDAVPTPVVPPPPEPSPTPTPTPTPPPDGDEDDPDSPDDPDTPDDHDTPDDPVDDPGMEPFPDVPPQSSNIDPSKPMIALSFDDGPGIYTDQFLDLLEKYNVRATFCTIGNLVNTQTDALARAVQLGCEVIGHSWDHKNMAKLSANDVRKQILDTSDTIRFATETAVPKFRPPYGAVSDTMRDVARELGFSLIYWSVDPEDWNTRDADEVYYSVMQSVKNGSIILSHEIYKSTLIAYEDIIPDLLLQGYQLVTVSELLYYKYGELEPGRVYYDGYDS